MISFKLDKRGKRGHGIIIKKAMAYSKSGPARRCYRQYLNSLNPGDKRKRVKFLSS